MPGHVVLTIGPAMSSASLLILLILLILGEDHWPNLVGIKHAVVLHRVDEVVTREPPPALELPLLFDMGVHPDAGLVLN
jgi:hypothetical protein